MELLFQTEQIACLDRVLQEVRAQEETGETIVPDSWPDIASVIDSSAVVVLRGKDCREGSVTLSGGIKGGLIYQPEEDPIPRSLEFYIPFTTKVRHPALSEQTYVSCDLRIRSVDGKMINSRKAMLRTELSCSISAWKPKSLPVYRLAQVPPELMLRKAVYPLRLAMEAAEKSFVLTENLQIPTGRPPVAQMMKLICEPEITDRKIIGDKAVFKGILHCRLLYLSDDQQVYSHRQSIPFSQYCQMAREYEEDEMEILPALTGYDLSFEGQAPYREGQLTVHVLAQCMICGTRDLELIEDGFTTSGKLTAGWETYAMETMLDCQSVPHSVRQGLQGEIREILDTEVRLDHAILDQGQDSRTISVPCQISVLGKDINGNLVRLFGRTGIARPKCKSGFSM